MVYETIVTVTAIKKQMNKIKNVGRIKSIEKRCRRLLALYYHVIIKY